MSDNESCYGEGFILTRSWNDTDDGVSLELWLCTSNGPVQLTIENQDSVFFIAQADVDRLQPLLGIKRGWSIKPLGLVNFENEPVAAVYFRSHKRSRDALHILRRHIRIWEADIRPPERYLMERFINAGVSFEYSLFQSKTKALGNATSSRLALNHPDSCPAYLSVKNPTLKPASVTPIFKVISVDIETTMDAKTLFSIGVYGADVKKVFMSGNENRLEIVDDFELIYCASERECFIQFLDWLEIYDPDILIGWSFIGFDLWVLSQLSIKLDVPFALGRNQAKPSWRIDPEENDKRYISIPGRIALDGIELLRTAFYTFASFSLEFVATELLGEGKLLKGSGRGSEITELFETDKLSLARYNLKDCELVWDIFEETKLLQFAAAKSRMTGMPLDRIGGSSASFEFAYLPRLHRKGYVAPSIAELKLDLLSPGGYVLDSEPGIYRNVLLFDFKSLYPSIIRTFKIDPYSFWYAEHKHLNDSEKVDGFNGAFFAREQSILPDLVAKLGSERDQAKKDNDKTLSFAIKIIMNSFYGVLGSPGCRFYDPRISSSITLRGHEIIQTTKRWIEDSGKKVIYGDTDSVFVWLGDDIDEKEVPKIGLELAKSLNRQWQDEIKNKYQLTSFLEIQFESNFLQFFMPSVRGAEIGSKKRYAGVVKNGDKAEVIYRGLESVRSDWTPLAREFQQLLYSKVFFHEPFKEFVKQYAGDVYLGKRDSDLIYRKRLRRKLEEYDRTSPPHVQAARKLAGKGIVLRKGDWVDYMITVNGPEPVKGMSQLEISQQPYSAIDYDHYIDKQLAPVADSLLQFLDCSFAQITDRQLGLFA